MAMNEVAEYPVFNREVLWAKYRECTYYKLSNYAHSKSTSWNKLTHKYTPLDPDLSCKICMKTQDSIISRNPDKTYFEYNLKETDPYGRMSEITVPVICGETLHTISLTGTAVGTEFLYSDILEMDDFYAGFSFTDCRVLDYNKSTSQGMPPQYVDNALSLRDDRLKIISEIVSAKEYALVDNIHKRAMVLSFINQSEE